MKARPPSAKASPSQPGTKPASGTTARPRRRGGEARGIADLVPEIGAAAFRRFGFVQSAILTRWDEIAGAHFAGLAQPEAIVFPRGQKAEGTLQLVTSGASAVLLQHAEPELIARVNRFFGYAAVARVRFRQGRLAASSPAARRAAPLQPAPPKPAPSPAPMPVELGSSLRAIADPELRTVLEALAQGIAARDAGARRPLTGGARRLEIAPKPQGSGAPIQDSGEEL